MTDEQSLVDRACRGDVPAYEALVRAHEQVAFRAAMFILHDRSEAADVAQDSFLRAYHALPTFQSGRPFRPWLLRIVSNQALNRAKALLRRDRTVQEYAREAGDTILHSDLPSPEQALVTRERSERLAAAVQKLAPDDQVLITLRYFLELPESEVAQALNIPLGTVKSRLHRTLARLRQRIQADFPDLGELVSGT